MDLTIYKIYEIQNKGKGVITTLTPDNLLSITVTPDKPGLQDVLDENADLTDYYLTRLNATAGWEIRGQEQNSGYLFIDGNQNETVLPVAIIGTREDSGDYEAEPRNTLEFYQNDIILRDTVNSRGIVNNGDYEANFIARSLITKQYLQSQISAIPPPTGAETKVNAGTNISVTGNGTTGTPYVINNTLTVDGSETKVVAGSGVSVSGTGTTGTPYIISTPTVPQVVPILLTSWLKDQQHTLNTGLTGVTIINAVASLQCTTANSGYVVGDIVTVGTPEQIDSGGIPDQGIGTQFRANVPGIIRVHTNQVITIMGAWTADGAATAEVNIGDESQWAIRVVVTYI